MADIILAKLEAVGSESDARGIHPPFSILYLTHALEKAGYSLKVIHEEGTEANIRALVDLVSVEKPFLVGFSVVTGPQILPSLSASREIKQKFDLPVVWGGIQPTLLLEQTLSKNFIDIIVIGEGERTIVELSQNIDLHGLNPERLESVRGLAFKKNGQIVVTPPRPFIKNLDEYWAAWHHLDIERYIRPEIYLASRLGGGERAIAVNTSRGCPWRCGYCYNVTFNKRMFRSQTAPRVIQEIKDLKTRFDLSSIRFSDDHFFSDRSRAMEIIRNIDIPWTATIRVDDLTRGGDEFVKGIAESQCALLRCGAESGSQRILDLMHKDTTLEQIRLAARLCKKYDITVAFFFMLGFPGETWKDICLTLDLMDELEAMGENISAAPPSIFCPFAGAFLYELAIKNGFHAPETLEDWGTTNDGVIRNTGHLPPYINKRVAKIIDYLHLARVRDFDSVLLSIPSGFLRSIANLRWKHRFFNFPVDWYAADLGRRILKFWGKM
jgi:anaerobic magnesium-protoporphyrin IX monomethyl ester cyclase